jgi:hypothetical protein
MKRHLLSVGLRFQIISQVTKDDAKTIQQLRNEALKTKIEELIATKQVNDANELIVSLRLEISALRRTLAQIQSANARANLNYGTPDTENMFPSTTPPMTPMFEQQFTQPLPQPEITEKTRKDMEALVTSFEEWKINNWINPSNKAQLSETTKKVHEEHVIDMLADAATRESIGRLSSEMAVVNMVRAGKQSVSAYFDAKKQEDSVPLPMPVSLQHQLSPVKPPKSTARTILI